MVVFLLHAGSHVKQKLRIHAERLAQPRGKRLLHANLLNSRHVRYAII
jgi:hypothetical protein